MPEDVFTLKQKEWIRKEIQIQMEQLGFPTKAWVEKEVEIQIGKISR